MKETSMQRRRLRLMVILALGLLAAPLAAEALQVVFLVRHAEQSVDGEDPPLTEAGHRRALTLATLLKDAHLRAIYTSETTRTIQTAAPLAKALQIESTPMPRRDIEGLMARLRTQHTHDRVLIVSHSRTLPALLKTLGHTEEVTIGRDEYDSLFVIVPLGGSSPVVVRLRF
jgi:broad specificity phosphatase PhoE